MERSIEREIERYMTDPEVLFDRQFAKLRKQMDKNIEQSKELQRKYMMFQQQWHDLIVRKIETSKRP